MAIVVARPHHLRKHIDQRKRYAAMFRNLMSYNLSQQTAEETKVGSDAYGETPGTLRCG